MADVGKTYILSYQKGNGQLIVRRVTLSGMNGNLITVFDHDRQQPRTYRWDRIVRMDPAEDEMGGEY